MHGFKSRFVTFQTLGGRNHHLLIFFNKTKGNPEGSFRVKKIEVVNPKAKLGYNCPHTRYVNVTIAKMDWYQGRILYQEEVGQHC